jgi:hypothetical protein
VVRPADLNPSIRAALGSAFYWKEAFLKVHHTLAGQGWNFYEIWIIITPVASGASRQHPSTADFSNRNQAIDYVEKFGPMLRLLDSEEDFDFLAAEEGYAPEIAHSHRTVRYQALQGYQQELIADFGNLCSAATAIALVNPDVARLLTRTRRALHRSVRYIALRMRLELLLPSPTPATKPSIFRKLLVRVIPRRNTPEKLLLAMNAIRNQLQLRP